MGRREKKGNKGVKGRGTKPPPSQPPKQNTKAGKKSGAEATVNKPVARKQPRSAAVLITCAAGNYGETLSLAKEEVILADAGY